MKKMKMDLSKSWRIMTRVQLQCTSYTSRRACRLAHTAGWPPWGCRQELGHWSTVDGGSAYIVETPAAGALIGSSEVPEHCCTAAGALTGTAAGAPHCTLAGAHCCTAAGELVSALSCTAAGV